MATGKTLGRYSKAYYDGIDQSGDSNNWSLKVQAPKADITSLASSTVENLYPVPRISGKQKGWFDNTVSVGLYTQLKGSYQARVATIAIGIRAAPAAGDPVLTHKLMTQVETYPLDYAQAVAMLVDLDGVDPTLAATVGIPFGVLLQPDGQLTSTTNGSIIDNLASSAAGALGILHVTAAGGTWSIKITHDTASNMATEATLMTFTSNGTSITGEALGATGTVNRYTRAVFTRTSGNFNGVVALVRG